MGRISGDPKENVVWDWLNTESKFTWIAEQTHKNKMKHQDTYVLHVQDWFSIPWVFNICCSSKAIREDMAHYLCHR